jgi:hypothetical protein
MNDPAYARLTPVEEIVAAVPFDSNPNCIVGATNAERIIQALVKADYIFPPIARWRHKKRGTSYSEIGRAGLQAADPGGLDDNDVMIVYRGDDGQLWVRPEYEFLDGRFERIDNDSFTI